MKSIFKYRPLNELLFKELYYQELYFASYPELNDPLDLSARIEFSCNKIKDIKSLLLFLFKTSISYYWQETEEEEAQLEPLVQFITDKNSVFSLSEAVLNEIKGMSDGGKRVWLDDIPELVDKAINQTSINVKFDYEKFNYKIERLTQKFLQKSAVSCFSETNDDFLMWSHYSSRHSGICLEFELNEKNKFPLEFSIPIDFDTDKKQPQDSKPKLEKHLAWNNIKKVRYINQQAFINFFEFAPVFLKEYDIDLLNLSKPWTHIYAQKLEALFATKTIHWQYEKEWRLIQINFNKSTTPEERIMHYPISALKAIYFGARTPQEAKKRIHQIYSNHTSTIKFFQSATSKGKELSFKEWEFYDDDDDYP